MFVWNFLLCSPATATWVVLTQKKKKTCNALVKHKKKIYANLFQIFCHFISRYFHWTMVFGTKYWKDLIYFKIIPNSFSLPRGLMFSYFQKLCIRSFKSIQDATNNDCRLSSASLYLCMTHWTHTYTSTHRYK